MPWWCIEYLAKSAEKINDAVRDTSRTPTEAESIIRKALGFGGRGNKMIAMARNLSLDEARIDMQERAIIGTADKPGVSPAAALKRFTVVGEKKKFTARDQKKKKGASAAPAERPITYFYHSEDGSQMSPALAAKVARSSRIRKLPPYAEPSTALRARARALKRLGRKLP